MRAVLASILWTALSATLLSAILFRGALSQLGPAALVVTAGYVALALLAIRPRRAILRARGAHAAVPVSVATPQVVDRT